MRNPRNQFFSTVLLAVMAFGIGLLAGACKPDYPACETDQDCKEKEFCVERKCQQCRSSADCAEGQECQAGKCSAVAGFCKANGDCPDGQACIGNRCQPCQSDGQCPSGTKCMAGRCAKAECSKDDDCPQDKDCVNGVCVSAAKPAAGPPCPLSSVYFAFDDSSLSGEATSTLASNVDCLKKADRPVNLAGHCDPRGTDEYNLALSERRASSVRDHLQRLGINPSRLRVVPKGAINARGADESSWAKDRRVDLEWQ